MSSSAFDPPHASIVCGRPCGNNSGTSDPSDSVSSPMIRVMKLPRGTMKWNGYFVHSCYKEMHSIESYCYIYTKCISKRQEPKQPVPCSHPPLPDITVGAPVPLATCFRSWFAKCLLQVLVVKGETPALSPLSPDACQPVYSRWQSSDETHPANGSSSCKQNRRWLQATKHQIFRYSLNILKQTDNLKPYTILFPQIHTRPSPNKSSQLPFSNLCSCHHIKGEVLLSWYIFQLAVTHFLKPQG